MTTSSVVNIKVTEGILQEESNFTVVLPILV